MSDYHVHVDHGEDEETHKVRVTEEGKRKVLLKFQYIHPLNGQLARDARREAMRRMKVNGA